MVTKESKEERVEKKRSKTAILVAVITLLGVIINGVLLRIKNKELEKEVKTLNNTVRIVQQKVTSIQQNNASTQQDVKDNGSAINAGNDVFNSGNKTTTNQKFDYSTKPVNSIYTSTENDKRIVREKLNEFWNTGKMILSKYESLDGNVLTKEYEKQANKWYRNVLNYLNANLDKSYADGFLIYNNTILPKYKEEVLVNYSTTTSAPGPVDDVNLCITTGLNARVDKIKAFIEKFQ